MKFCRPFAAFVFVLSFLAAAPGQAQSEESAESKKHGFVTMWVPPSNFFPMYTADPVRPQSAITILQVVDPSIPHAGDTRFGLNLGGRFSFIRWHPEGEPNRGWQIDFEGGFLGQFDIDHSWDNIGWDGFYGLYLSWLPSPNFGFRFGSQHDSAHIGDEYIDGNGAERAGYTRESVVFGASWKFDPKWLVYGEVGYGSGVKYAGKDAQLQAGVEYFSSQKFWKKRLGWYAALDLRSYQESDWDLRTTGQIGVVMPTGRGTARYRVAIEIGSGRSYMGEFFRYDETYVRMGLYYDF